MVERSIHGQPGMVFLGYDTDGECLWGAAGEKVNMSIPLDGDWNDIPAKIEEDMTDAGKADKLPRQAKGGAFAPADVPLIKRALHIYLIDCMRADEDHPDITHISNLFHRLNRI